MMRVGRTLPYGSDFSIDSDYSVAMRPARLAITKLHISYVPLNPVADYVHMLDLNTGLRIGLKTLHNLKFKLKF